MDRIKVVVIDEQELFRAGVHRVLSEYGGFEIAECAPTEHSFHLVEAMMPDVILLGCRLSTPEGLEFSRKVARRFPKARVVILSPDGDDKELFEVIKSSAISCVSKNASSVDLVATIKMASASESSTINIAVAESTTARNVSARPLVPITNDMLSTYTKSEALDTPTSREVEILSYIADGNSNKQIASALHISVQTVKNHVSNIMRRSRANDRAHATYLAICHGWITVEAGQPN